MSNGNGVRIHEGLPHPLGATWDGMGVNFALFSAHATKVELCLFDPAGERELERVELPEYTDEVWHGYLPDVDPGHRLRLSRARALRAARRAPLQSEQAAARPLCEGACRRAEVGARGVRLHDRRRGRRPDASTSATARRSCPSAGSSIPLHLDGDQPRRAMPWDRTIIYEAHVRGFTKLHPRGARGSCAAPSRGWRAARSSTTSRSLGVTAVELLPIHTFINDSHLLERGLTNYWGYNTHRLLRARPALRSRRGDSLREFKEMVARLHDAGLEVILDVVYNHTAEGNERGPTLSFKGIDNASLLPLAARISRATTSTTPAPAIR